MLTNCVGDSTPIGLQLTVVTIYNLIYIIYLVRSLAQHGDLINKQTQFMLKIFAYLLSFNIASLLALFIIREGPLTKIEDSKEHRDKRMLDLINQIRQLTTYPVYQTLMLIVLAWFFKLKRIELQIHEASLTIE